MVAETYPVQQTNRRFNITGTDLAIVAALLVLLAIILVAAWPSSTLFPENVNGIYGYINHSG